jgi:hypothetical protein
MTKIIFYTDCHQKIIIERDVSLYHHLIDHNN